ncbi:MAG TPA: hypothetical protein VLZ83_06420 [Edaphocola sp.]|nr:hypothetical protein [Edaphocola sp.]
MAFEKNKKAIDEMINVPDDLVEKYGTRNLDTLKQRMLEDLKFQYQIENAYSYKFSKDGFLSLLNEKNGAERKLYKFEVNDGELQLNLLEDSSDFSESIFEGGSSLSIRNSDKDSIILIDYAGTMSDTIFFKRIK